MDRLDAQSLPPSQLALATTGVLLALFLSVFSQTILGLVQFTLCSNPAGFSQSMTQLVVFRLFNPRSWRQRGETIRREATAMTSFTAQAASCIVAITLFCCAAAGFGQAPEGGPAGRLALSLEEAVRLAVRNNRDLINARLGRVAERFSLRVAENKFRPHVSIGPYVDRTHTAPSTDIDTVGVSSTVTLRLPVGSDFRASWSGGHQSGGAATHSQYTNELEFTFTQPLLRSAGIGVNTASVRTARLAEEINVLALRQTIIDVVSAVIRSYRGYMQAERRVDIRARSLQRARELLAVSRLLVETGRMAERDLVQAQADIAGRELQLVAAQNSLDAARLALTDILDIDSRTRIRLTDTLGGTLDAGPPQTDAADRIETALRHRPDYLRAVLGVRIAEVQVTVADNERLWDLSAAVSTRISDAPASPGGAPGRPGNTDYGLRLYLSVPIGPAAVDPGRQKHVEAVVDLRKARNNLANWRQRVDIEVSNALREVDLTRRQVELARAARELVEQTTEIEKEKLRLGLSSNFRLVAFEDALVAAQNSELDALIGYQGALTSLDRTLGTTLERWNIEIGDVDREEGLP